MATVPARSTHEGTHHEGAHHQGAHHEGCHKQANDDFAHCIADQRTTLS